jgi:hypothetical protein
VVVVEGIALVVVVAVECMDVVVVVAFVDVDMLAGTMTRLCMSLYPLLVLRCLLR